MIRPIAALTVLALLSGVAAAQEIAPAAPAATPPAADIMVDPAATTTPRQANMLTGFYATQAVIEICALELDAGIKEGMAADRQRLETSLSMDAAAGSIAYGQVKSDVQKTAPDCTEGSPDRLSVDAVTAIYKAQAAAAPAEAAPTPGTVVAPAPATPAPPAAAPAAQ